MYIWLMRVVILIFLLLTSFLTGRAQKKKLLITPSARPGLRFTENKGQWESNIDFMVRMNNGNMFIEKNKITYFLFDYQKFRTFHTGGAGLYGDKIPAHAYEVIFENCRQDLKPLHTDALNYYENFYIGDNKEKWKSNVISYKRVVYPELYPSVDLEFVTNDRQLKYNFHVKPGGDYHSIQLKYNGTNGIHVKDGKLLVETSIGTVVEEQPFAFQTVNSQTIQIPCKYKVSGETLSFDISGPYDRNLPLVIDPLLVFAAQSGSTADNFGMTATYDAQGNLYTGGTIFNVGYPVTVGAYSNVFNGPPAYGNTDVVITKYNSNGTGLLFSTYLGGSGSEVVGSLIVNASNQLYLYGATGSANFPTTTGAFDNTFNGGSYLFFTFNGTKFNSGTDIYVTCFNAAGSSLLASTYVGGSANDGVNHVNAVVSYTALFTETCPTPTVLNIPLTEHRADSLQYNYGDQYRGEIQLDKQGNVYIASSTRSSNFPAINGFDNTLDGQQDAVVFKFNPGLSSLVWSNFLGGSGNDAGYSLIVTDSMFTYVTGGTWSTDFPVQTGCYSTSYNGGKADGYVAKINPQGNAILKATYLGTNSYDQSYFVQKDNNSNIYVYGQSLGNMPVIGPVYSNPNSHQFITQFNNQLTQVNRSTVIGSGQSTLDISPSAFSVDNCGNIYISGWGGNITDTFNLSGMPTSTNALYPTPPNGRDFYLMTLSPGLSSFLYGTYFGGNCSEEHVDGGTSRFDPKGKIYQSVCAGCGGNDDFPVSPGAWPCGYITACPPGPNLNANCNNGVFKIDFQLNVAVANILTNTLSGCVPVTVSFTNAIPSPTFMWYSGAGQTNSVNPNPSFTYTNPGTYTISLVVIDPATCNVKDSTSTIINVLPGPNAAFTASYSPCSNTVSLINNSTGTLTSNPFMWNWGDGSATSTITAPSHTYTSAGLYTISLSATAANGCTAAATQTVSVSNFSPAVTGATLCAGGSTTLYASGGTAYTWTPSGGLSSVNSASTIANPTASTVYTIQIDNNSTGFTCSRSLTAQVTVLPKPSAAFSASLNPCGGGVYFTDLSVSNITAWQWTLAPSVTYTVQNPYYFYPAGGTNTVTLIVTNADGCKDTSQQVITVNPPPPVSVNAATLICTGKTAQLSASGGMSYQWTPTVSLDISNIPSPSASPTVTTVYSVVITATNGCTFLLTTTVNVSQFPGGSVAAIADPPYVITGNGTSLIYLGAPGANVTWYPLGSTAPTTGYTVGAFPDRPTTYTAVVTNGACSDKTTVHVEAYSAGCIDKDVFVPNTFTPNSDGQNDIFIVRGLKVQEIYFAVYNRWGEMVFETTDKTKGWDGIYKGRPADVGVFGWYLKVKCFNGEETFRKGNVTLIR